MKKIILMTMLMSAVFAQSDCNKDNWREYYNSEGRDMTDCDLYRADLRGEWLRDANLEGALLVGANLESAGFYRANLERANLAGANLRWASLKEANLYSADLRVANLELTDLGRANLEGVKSSRIEGEPASLPKGWSLVDGRLIKKDGE